MKKLTYWQFRDAMIAFNKTAHKDNMRLFGVIVFTPDSFTKPYSEIERSYKTDNEQKAFWSKYSNSLFADCLDGKDNHVRLDWYMDGTESGWKVDYCYLLED